jgi:regulator of sigma E protease
MAAGVFLNLVTALVMLTVLAWVGIPQIVDNQFTVKSDTKVIPGTVVIAQVEKNSPADKAGLKAGDTIVSIGAPGEELKQVDSRDLPGVTQPLAIGGTPAAITYERDGVVKKATIKLRSVEEVVASKKTDNPKGYLGVVPAPGKIAKNRSTWSAPVVAVGLTGQFTQLTFQGLGRALGGLGSLIAGALTGNSDARSDGQKRASEQVSGPVGIFYVLKEGRFLGIEFILLVIALISLTLAIMNILPIPALDGGRLWLTLISHGIGKPLSQEKEELINGIGMLVLLTLIALITVVDVKRFF